MEKKLFSVAVIKVVAHLGEYNWNLPIQVYKLIIKFILNSSQTLLSF